MRRTWIGRVRSSCRWMMMGEICVDASRQHIIVIMIKSNEKKLNFIQKSQGAGLTSIKDCKNEFSSLGRISWVKFFPKVK